MKNIFYYRISNAGSGMTNQLFTFITGILIAIHNNKNIMILDNFSCDFQEGKLTPISEIIDLEKLNTFLKKKEINLTLFDKYKVTLDLPLITYGINNKVIDVTSRIVDCCYTFDKKENQQRFFWIKKRH